MIVRRIIAVAATLFVLVGTACRDRSNEPMPAETDDPYFVQGRQLQRQGRNPEALTAFLKVIEKRGERSSAESHLWAGQIYLNHTKDPVEAYHHFRKYLELQPNSREAELVRGMVKAALREFARTVPGRPLDDQSMRLQADDEAAKLRREVEELRAELAVLRGGGGVPVNRASQMIRIPASGSTSLPVPTTPVVGSPITRAPYSPPANPITSANSVRPGTTPNRGTSPSPSRANTSLTMRSPSVPAGRTHTVVAKDTLFNISKRYGVKMEDLAAANGLPSVSSSLKLGTVLKIPASTGAR
jgi:LysM repeat protein